MDDFVGISVEKNPIWMEKYRFWSAEAGSGGWLVGCGPPGGRIFNGFSKDLSKNPYHVKMFKPLYF